MVRAAPCARAAVLAIGPGTIPVLPTHVNAEALARREKQRGTGFPVPQSDFLLRPVGLS
jgi:hypothetical protein